MAADIPALVAPILAGKADVVIGSRPINEIKSFSPVKKLLQKAGSAVVRFVSKTRHSRRTKRIPGHDPRSRHALQCVQ